MTTAQNMINTAKKLYEDSKVDFEKIVKVRTDSIKEAMATKPIVWEKIYKWDSEVDRASQWMTHCKINLDRTILEWEGDTITSLNQLLKETTDADVIADINKRLGVVREKNLDALKSMVIGPDSIWF
jgi:Cys-tRNA synthase (O-phospho-L-seryl-tRNA:Cys-tRNA synthase)